MKIDVARAIRDLLFEHDEVVIPGLGAFVTRYQPATIDHVQGHMMPPSRQIIFNPELTIDDGRLVAWMIEHYGLSATEAQQVIADYVQKVKSRLKEGKRWKLPHLGELFRDFEGTYGFDQATRNFTVDTFGLPELDAAPVITKNNEHTASTHYKVSTATSEVSSPPQPQIKEYNTTPVAFSTAKVTQSATEVEEAPMSWLYKLIPILIVIALCVVLFSIWVVFFQSNPSEATATSPVLTTPIPLQDEPEDQVDLEAEATQTSDAPPSETDVLPPDTYEAFVVLHSFSHVRNAERFAEKLVQDGFNAASVQDGRLLRVGVRFTWRDSTELQQILQTLGRTYKTKPRFWQVPPQ